MWQWIWCAKALPTLRREGGGLMPELVLKYGKDEPMPDYRAVVLEKDGMAPREYGPERECELRLLWVDYEDGEAYECSACDGIVYTHGLPPRYCSECGAKVKEVR